MNEREFSLDNKKTLRYGGSTRSGKIRFGCFHWKPHPLSRNHLAPEGRLVWVSTQL